MYFLELHDWGQDQLHDHPARAALRCTTPRNNLVATVHIYFYLYLDTYLSTET
jgi:hypothetical protein